MLIIACLVAESMQPWFVCLCRPTASRSISSKREWALYRTPMSTAMPSLNVIAYILSEIAYCKLKVKFEKHLHTQTRVVYLKISSTLPTFPYVLVQGSAISEMETLLPFDVRSKWRASVIVKLRHSSGHQKLARKEGSNWPDSVHMSYMRRSCDHHSRRRVLTISNWNRTYRGLLLQQVEPLLRA